MPDATEADSIRINCVSCRSTGALNGEIHLARAARRGEKIFAAAQKNLAFFHNCSR
jgi:hypothetical protein